MTRHARLRRLLERVLGRGDAAAGADVAGDLIELFADRRAARGAMHAAARAAVDVMTLMVRPRRGPRASIGKPAMPSRIGQDLRHALRSIGRRPLRHLPAFAVMALGTALGALVFVVVRGVLLAPLPFPDGDRLVSVYTEFRPESGYDIGRSALSWPEFLDYQHASRAMDVAAYLPIALNLARPGGDPERVIGARTTSGAFALMGVAPAIGRVLDASHDAPGGPCGLVLSDGLWRDWFAGDPRVVGQVLTLDGGPCEVLGVMPPRFDYPSERARAWVPFPIDRGPDDRGSHGVLAIARLRPGSTMASAEGEREALMARWAESYPHHRGHGLIFVGYRNDLVGDLRLPLLVLAVSIGLVLAVLAANVSSLFAAQGERRRRELAVRAALGAGRARLVMQIAWESVLVCVSGGVAGVAVAWWSAAPLVRAYPGTLPRAGEIQLDGSVVFGSLMAVTLIGLLAGAAPAHGLTRTALSDGLRAGDRGSSGRVRRSRQVLIAAELALSCAVTIAAFLLVQSFTRLQSTPLGFDPDRVVTATVSVSGTAAASEAEATRFFDDLVARLQAHPGVAAAGAMSSVPLVNRPPPDDFMIEGRPASPPGEPGFNAHYVVVTPGVFEALGARIMRGRAIDARDIAPDAPVAVINETLQRRYWPDRDPLGGRIRYPTGIQDGEWSSWTPWISVVGVLDDLRSVVPAAAPEPAIYVAHAQRPRAAYSGATMGVVVRPRADGGAAPSVIRDAARSVDPRAVATPARPLAAVVGTVLARPRFVGGLMSLLAATTLAIAVIGVYGLVSHTVSSRTREIGVRMALGASRGRILTLVARQLWTTLGAGLPAGLLGAWLLARWMDALLYGVEPWEPRIYLAVAASLTFVVVAAVVAPARRAARVDPSGALRAE